MFKLTTWLYASLTAAGLVDGFIAAPFKKAQEVFGTTDLTIPLAVTVNADATISYPAEIADFNVIIRTSGLTEDAARQEMSFATDRLEALLKDLSFDPDSWSAAPVRIQSPGSGSRGTPGYMLFDDAPNLDGSASEYQASGQLKIHLKQLDRLHDLEQNISTSSQINLSPVILKLSEETAARAKKEVRAKAFENVVAAARDYAAMLGMETVKPLELEDAYTSSNNEMQYYYNSIWSSFNYDGLGMQSQKIQTRKNLRYKFSLT